MEPKNKTLTEGFQDTLNWYLEKKSFLKNISKKLFKKD